MALAKLCGLGGNYIGQIEMGRRIPSFGKIEKIAAALGVPSCELFSSEKDEAPKSDTRDYLQKMPLSVRKELSSHILSLLKTDISASLDSKNY